MGAGVTHKQANSAVSTLKVPLRWVLYLTVIMGLSFVVSTARTHGGDDAAIAGAAAATLTRGPYLQVGTPNSVVVRWRTAESTMSRVEYGDAPDNLTGAVIDSVLTTEHEIEIAGLSPDARYYYAIGTDVELLAGADSSHFYHTPPTAGPARPTRILVLGDSGAPWLMSLDVRDSYLAYAADRPADFWLMLGDNAYPGGTDEEYQAAVFDAFPTILRSSVLWPTQGNHDIVYAGPNNDYYDFFSFPTAGEAGGVPSGADEYYSFDYANIHFICLDSQGSDRSSTGPMLTWLQNDIAATTQDWVIAFFHHAPYSKGNHDSDDPIDSAGRMIDMRENALPIMEAAGLDLVLTGHSHSYERSFMIDGHYSFSSTLDGTMIVDGGDGSTVGDGAYIKPTAGKNPHEGTVYAVLGSSSWLVPTGTYDHPVMTTSLTEFGFILLDIDGNRLDLVFVDENQNVRDRFTMFKGITNNPPTASFVANPTTGHVPLDVSFDASASFDPDADSLIYVWDFDDGSAPGSGQSLVHTFLSGGSFNVKLTVSDGISTGVSYSTIQVQDTTFSELLIHHWSLDDGSGTTAIDSVGSYDGTLVNGPLWEPTGGVFGGALRFDGEDDYVDLGDVNIPGGDSLTISLWINADDFDVHDGRLISKASGSAEDLHFWMLSTVNNTGLRFRVKADGSTATLLSNTGEIAPGQWYHVAGTYDGQTMRIYSNGDEIASMAKTGPLDDGTGVTVALGNQPPSAGSDPFDGMIDDVRIYARTLSAAEIATLASVNRPPVASNNGYQTNPNTLLVVNSLDGVLKNDSDPESDPLQAVLESDVTDGILNLSSDGSFDYMPNLDFTGTDTFTYRAHDGSLGSNVASVTISVYNDSIPNLPPQIVTGTMEFAKQVIGTGLDETHSAVAADLDGDGDKDVAATDYIDGMVFWYENDGSGGFVPHVLDPDLEGAYPSHVGDVDLDGDSDILACGYLANTIVWYENDGGANFTRQLVDSLAMGAHSVVTGDMDQDGDVDLLASYQDSGDIAWYENDGSQTFTRYIIDSNAPGAKRAEFSDVDDDGDWDVVTASQNVAEVAWLENDGSQNFTKHVISNTASGAYYATPADVDDDGDVDVLSASRYDHTVAWYANDGNENFTVQYMDTDALGARTVIAVDLDRDGDLDPLSASVDDDRVSWYENDGAGGLTKRTLDDDANGSYGLFAIDMENDGDLDVLSARRDADEVVLLSQYRSHQAYLANRGGTLVVDETQLLTIDADDGPADLTYTIISGPDAGALKLDGVTVSQGGTFTQDDVNNYRVTYVHDGSGLFADEFDFVVADGGESGVNPTSGIFKINIADPTALAYWPLDETSGLVAEDVDGNNDGTLVGGPTWRPSGGRIGGALEFDGSDDYVDIGTLDVGGGSGLSLVMWLQPSAFIDDSRMISKASGQVEQDHYWMISQYQVDAIRFRLKAGGVTSTLISPTNELDIGQWYHLACTYDGSTMRIYGNGVLVASQPKTGVVDTNPSVAAAIGDQPPGAGDKPFAGWLDEVRIFDRALSEAEIAVLADTTGPPTGVLPDYDDDGSDPTANAFALHHNYPNPFNPSTTIRFELAHGTDATLEIFDVRGRRVRTLVNGRQPAGEISVVWDGRDDRGLSVATGVYFVRLRTPQFTKAIKINLIE
jgi:PKD repeat protein